MALDQSAAAQGLGDDLGSWPARPRRQHVLVLPRPHANVVDYTTELEKIEGEKPWEPRVFPISPKVSDQQGTANSIHKKMFPAVFNGANQGTGHSGGR